MTTAPLAPQRRARRGPVDPRLWRYSHAARRYLVLTVALSLASTSAVVATGMVVATVLAGIITDPNRRTLGSWSVELGVLIVAIGVRVATGWAQARYGQRSASRVIAELNARVLDRAVAAPLRELDAIRDDVETLITRGTTNLRPYLAGYLPALILAMLVPPIVLVVIALHDVVSAGIILVTLPLIPFFMVLIGLLTRGRSQRTLAAMSRLSAQLLDLLSGLPTLRALGRERGPEREVAELGDDHRRRAMSALRIAFLSSMVLELLATLSVALVAVSIGLRLVVGEMGLQAGLVALILAPEAYNPLRALGERFHASEDGTAAASRAFEVLDSVPDVPSGARRRAETSDIEVDCVSVRSRTGFAPERFSVRPEPGSVTALTGANGSGKTTALHTILGLSCPDAGEVRIGGIVTTELDTTRWWRRVAWLPQRPVLAADTVRANLELDGPLRELDACCAATGFDAVLAELPRGLDTMLGPGGVGLSLGQRQRLALTRVLGSGKPVLLLDEPTAHLDEASEAAVLHALREAARAGATVLLVAHRPSVLRFADRVVEVHGNA